MAQQGQQGAILIRWESPQAGMAQQAPQVLQSSIQYIDQLASTGKITEHREYVSLTEPGGFAVLEGPVEQLIDLAKDPDYRKWLMVCQGTFARFQMTVAIGGQNGDVETVLNQQRQAQQQTQQFAEQGPQALQTAGSR